ncbi:TlpA family protein disulfide reductase [Niabella sp. CJ426]|uniref:TlpA family protein disulfide reductase n=1 Tax=Niabella sp. CJ426 TaxID=3393740 RepID=UPI003D00A172
MKLFTLVVAIAMTLPSFAQEKENRPRTIEDSDLTQYLNFRKIPQLSVRVINSKTPLEGVEVKYSAVHIGAEMQTKNFSRLDATGTVQILLTENLPYQQVWLNVEGLYYTGVLVNDGLEIIIDAGKSGKETYIYGDNISFKGADAGLNNILCKHILYKKREREKLMGKLVDISIDAANRKLAQEPFLKTADSIYIAMQQIDTEFFIENQGYQWAVKNETKSAFYEWLVVGLKGDKETGGAAYQDMIRHKPYFMSNSGAGFYRNLSSYLANKKDGDEPDIQKLLYAGEMSSVQKEVLDSINYYRGLTGENEKKSLDKLYSKRYTLFKKEIDKIYCLDALRSIENNANVTRADILKLSLMERWKDNFSVIYPLISSTMKTGWTKNLVQRQLNEFTSRKNEINKLFMSAGKLSGDQHYIGNAVANLPFGARLYTLDSIDNIDQFIVNLKSKFKNKALVIDIWATWCGPCIADITNSKKLHDESKDLPVEYIYLCTTSGSDIETWKTRIGTLRPPGTHIFIDEKLESEFRKKLNAEGGYPTYIVIDQKGNIGADKISFMSELNKESLKKKTGID